MTESGIPRVSIVIPHLNQPEFLARCLAALAPQIAAVTDAETIVVDNGSKTLPAAICAPYPWVKLTQEATPGPGPARNLGISKAQGILLAFIDADCVPDPHWLSSILAAFESNPAVVIAGGDVRIGLTDAARPTALEAYECVFAYRQKDYIEQAGFSGTGNLAMRRQAFEAVGPFAGIELAEDRDWGRRANARGLRIHYLESMIVYHPARQSFAELRGKWDRHVSHDYADLSPGLKGKMIWAGLALAVAVSGVMDCRKIVVSNRLSTFRERLLAAVILARIRLYRSSRMLSQLFRADYQSRKWNR